MKSNSGPVYWILPLSITFYHTAATPRGPKEWKHQYPWGQLINCHHFLSRTDCSFKQEIKYCTTHNSSECGSFRCSYMPQNKCHSSNQDPVFPVCVLLSCVLSFIFFPVSPSPVCVMDLRFSLRVCGCTPAADSCLSDSGTKSPGSQFLLARPFSRLASSRVLNISAKPWPCHVHGSRTNYGLNSLRTTSLKRNITFPNLRSLCHLGNTTLGVACSRSSLHSPHLPPFLNKTLLKPSLFWVCSRGSNTKLAQ